MNKRRLMNDKAIARLIKEGRGQGVGCNYVPWIKVGEFPSKSICTEVYGWTTNRVHHLLSQLELYCFYIFDWSDTIIDIREQYPLLDINDSYFETQDIAKQIGIRYPTYPHSQTPYVMTTDFVVTVLIGSSIYKQMALTVKPAGKIDKRVLEKYEVERQYWNRRGIEWKIVTEKSINKTTALNVKMLHKCISIDGYSDISMKMVEAVLASLSVDGRIFEQPIKQVVTAIDTMYGFMPGASLFILKHLMATKKVRFDITREIDMTEPLARKMLK